MPGLRERTSNLPGCFPGLKHVFSRSKEVSRIENSNPALRTSLKSCRSSDVSPGLECIPCTFEVDSKRPIWTIGKDNGEKNLPPPYTTIAQQDMLYRSDILATIESSVASHDAKLRELNLKIHDHPELGFKEYYAHDTLTAFLETHGFKVTRHLLGMDTAWRAEWSQGSGGRTLGINAEMDALPGLGHACGHNLIATAGIGIVLALKDALKKHEISGKIIILGTPAEEGGGGKVKLLDKGAYKDMDVCMMTHPAPGPKNFISSGSSSATQPFTVEYFGHTAHAAAAPWEGQNALDAAVLAYQSVAVLRQQIKPDCRIHGIIEGRNWAANIIPDYAKMSWIVRAPSRDEKEILFERVKDCVEAAALAAGCQVKISLGVAYDDLRQNSVLEAECLSIANSQLGLTAEAKVDTNASTDFGNVSYALPSLHPNFSIPTVPGGGNHTPEFTEAARTLEAHKAMLEVVKVLALLGARVLDDKSFFRRVQDSYDDTLRAAT